jgi:lipoprotein-anchoring transpeptidase ErfK/SrfK
MRRTGASLVVALVMAAVATAPAAAQRSTFVRASQTVVALKTAHKVVRTPSARHTRVTTVAARRPITGVQTVLPVLHRATTKDGVRWLQVRVPGRPNGRRGWIAQRGTTIGTTPWRLVVRTGRRRVQAYKHGRLARTFAAVVGKPSTPTPHGRFFVEESVRMLPGSAGGPFALALSARSSVLQEFEGGPGQIALHGIANLGGSPGTAVSHGCVRLANADVTWLASRIGPGVPVALTR